VLFSGIRQRWRRTRTDTESETMQKRERKVGRDRYAAAFERVRLVRAWIAAAAALVTVISAYVAVIERILR
jgi:hypothetical protein